MVSRIDKVLISHLKEHKVGRFPKYISDHTKILKAARLERGSDHLVKEGVDQFKGGVFPKSIFKDKNGGICSRFKVHNRQESLGEDISLKEG